MAVRRESGKPRRSGRVALALGAAASLASVIALAQTAPPPSINSTSVSRAAGPYTPVPQQPLPNDGLHRIIVSNDLGMHCADLDARIASILPPFNVVHAQVLAKGVKPTLLDDTTVRVEYSASANPNDPAAAKTPTLAANGALFKTNFWAATVGYAPFYPAGLLAMFYPASPRRYDIGLPVPDVARLFLGDGKLVVNQQTMPSVTAVTFDPTTHAPTSLTAAPYRANVPQPFRTFEKSWPAFKNFVFGYVAANTNWFAAEGIPITTFDNLGRENSFPLMRVVARDKASGAALAGLDAVVPVSGETNCKTCHLPSPSGNGLATGRAPSPKVPTSDPLYGKVPTWVSEEWASDVNTLTLHDVMHGTKLFTGFTATNGLAAKPIVCQTCHYTPALDLAQAGPQATNGLAQTTNQSMSRVMHNGHGKLKLASGAPMFPLMPAANSPLRAPGATGGVNAYTQTQLEATCYQCHPGKRTQCLRGAMYSQAGAVCQDCHGQMTQVGADFSRNLPAGGFIIAADFYKNPATPRVPWLNEPTCGSCHTGDAVSNLTAKPGAIKAKDNIRLLQAYLSTDAKATPILPTNLRFAEPRVATGTAAGNPQLFRLSVDKHGGVFCEGCHGATHAEWPVANPNANDNLAATELQGHAGKVVECDTCHTGSLGTTLGGPHGMHPVGASYSAAWVSSHGDFADSNGTSSCKACHGLTGQGTPLSKVAANRTGLRCEQGALCKNGSITLTAGTQATCTSCHSNPL